MSRNFCGNQCQGRKTWTAVDKLIQAQCGRLWALGLQGDPIPGNSTLLLDLPRRAHSGSHSEYWKKIPLCFRLGEREGTIFEIQQSMFSFLTRHNLSSNYFTRMWSAGILPEPKRSGERKHSSPGSSAFHMGEGKHPVSAHCNLPVGKGHTQSQACPAITSHRRVGGQTEDAAKVRSPGAPTHH